MPRIRPAHVDDLPAISVVCLAAFNAAVAPTLGADGIATFASVATADAFGVRLQGDNHILVAELGDHIVGVIELKAGRHLAMLFVDPACQGQGIGHALFEAVLPQVREPVLTVRASLNAVPTYLRYGFVLDGDVGKFNGLVYQQMVRATA
ncbi:GNAT family N-acetyltransferase [Stenotrophomonas maltophilia]|uniref:GNAT family N-acetyltransferase n=1 Tax=Stenotrophomonas maltophilia TaxID=40324 RepID=UPI0013DA4F65|nr:GNAT family N-acetyltransferase [Stenotrophomonas maltophilia]MBA0282503.1 GNAT family N-acetyltransferase [Stenotrophomonas maltophilia]MBA0344381.1 GNAT family N-acetyltransferase [Stenotrophomonas maltophilia]MBA0356678.1 GNAT family N-acetyltransferase [Stenotrophomonas maltophilia]MBA0518157.1 GNAT family N-acetyltransferase [Stenotrophomonas maltophilia]